MNMIQMSFRVAAKAAFVVLGISLLSTRSAFGAPTLSTDNGTTIGAFTTPKNYPGYSAFWKSGAPDYSVLTDGVNTYLNAPTASGTIFFRGANNGVCDGPPAPDPDGQCSRMWLASTGLSIAAALAVGPGYSTVMGSLTAYGYGSTPGAASVFGSSITTAAGVAGTSFGNGIEGWSLSASVSGVQGLNTARGYGVHGIITPAGVGTAIYGSNDTTATGGWAGYFEGKIKATGTMTAVSFIPSSDARLKKDIKNLAYGIDAIERLRPVTYNWKDGKDPSLQVGLIAQEVQKVVPEVVKGDASVEMLGINYMALVPVLIKATQEQQAIIAKQEARIAALELGRSPTLSSLSSGWLGKLLALGLLPFGIILGLRRRQIRAE